MKDDIEKVKVQKLNVFNDRTTTIALLKNNNDKRITKDKRVDSSIEYQEINISERDITKLLRQQLLYKFEWIKIFSNPASSKIARNYLRENLGYFPLLQPEIDMIFLEKSFNLNAVEIKLFRSNDINYRWRFYKGIDQALALHRYGFDHVALWHFFYPNVSFDEINRYGAEVWSLIRDCLKLPLDFSYYKILFKNNEYKFQVLQYEGRNKGFSLGATLDDPEFRIEWRYENPQKNDKVSIAIRESFIKYMKIPTIKIYNSGNSSLDVIADGSIVTSPINQK